MADEVSGSGEEIAYRLLLDVAYAEGKQMRAVQAGGKPDRKWILDTYAECIRAVRMPSKRGE